MSFSTGAKYANHVWCDVVDMATCHLLLGKPWQDDKTAIYDETKNTYSFMVGKIRLTILPSQEAEPKPSQGDGQSFVAKRKLMGMGSRIKGVVPEPVKEVLEEFVDSLQNYQKGYPNCKAFKLNLVWGWGLTFLTIRTTTRVLKSMTK